MKKKGLGSPAYELGIHIKKYREQKNWSQDDLASKIGTDQKRISKIETGNVNIGWDTFYQIAQALEVSMDELVEGDLVIVIGLIGGYGSPRRALYTITDELMNSAYRFKRGWQFKNSLP